MKASIVANRVAMLNVYVDGCPFKNKAYVVHVLLEMGKVVMGIILPYEVAGESI